MTKLIAPSILAADFARMGEELRAIEDAGADWVHLDVMDGHFVPNLTMGPALVRTIRSVTKLPFDAHLMVEEPGMFVEPFIEAGVNWISIHVETPCAAETLMKIKDLGCRAGIAINPSTRTDGIIPYLTHVDYVLVMTVNPGFAGQKMIEDCVKKIDVLKAYRAAQKLNYLIQVDGGINLDTIERVKNADVFVAGNGIFKADDYSVVIEGMKRIVEP